MNYDGRTFRPIGTSGGDVGAETRFDYHQHGEVVWATYAGGAIRFGTLLARVAPDGVLDMRYQQVAIDGTIKTGRCRSTPEILPDGRLRLHEVWEWTEGGSGAGTSQIEET